MALCRIWIPLVVACAICGCSEKPKKENKIEQAGSEFTASDVIDRAIEALGGDSAIQKMKKGQVKFEFHVFAPRMIKKFGSPEVIVEASFDLPSKEKRVVTSKDGSKKTTTVTNGDKLHTKSWNGTDKVEAAPRYSYPYSGPYIVAVLANLKMLKQSATRFKLDTSKLEQEGNYVIEILINRKIISRLVVHDKTWHLIKHEKYSASHTESGEQILTAVLYGAYKDYSGVKLPGTWEIRQDGSVQMTGKILEARFVDSIDSNLFQIPKMQTP